MAFVYHLGARLSRGYFRTFHQVRSVNAPVVPATGGLIVAPNHASFLDPPLVGAMLPQREIHFMARSTLFKIPILGFLIKRALAHPVERGKGPNQNWDLFLNLLNQGKALLVFPEGTRTETGELQRGKTGFGRLVHMAKKPVYPIYIQGTYEAMPKKGKGRRVPITVYFGDPLPLDDLFAQPAEKRVEREISQRVMDAIAALKAQADAGGEKPHAD